jgi:hypothetical protein
MAGEKARITVENLIADHVSVSFKARTRSDKGGTTAARTRNLVTDRFRHRDPGSEQDNAPPAVVALPVSRDRAAQLADLRTVLERVRRGKADASPRKDAKPVPIGLLLERQQLALRNELTEGFGRIEIWLVSLATLALVLLRAIDFLWAPPILALGIGRSWHLDRQGRKRLARIAEIDALIGTAAP